MLAPTIAFVALAVSGQLPSPEVAVSVSTVPGDVSPPEVAAADAEIASTVASTIALLAPPPAAVPALVARSSESMEFSVSYLGLPMGKARIAVGHAEPGIVPVFLLAQTSSLLSFVTLKQHLVSYLDLDTGLPRSSKLDAVEGGYRHTDTTHFDRAANKATVRVRGKYDNTNELDVPPGTTDFVGLIFKLRTLPLGPGDRHEFPLLAGRRLKTITAEVVGRETVSTKIGEFPTVKVRVPTGLTGKFSEKNPTHVWFSDDTRRIVVRIQSDFAIGHATAGLVGYSPGSLPPGATARP